MTRDPQSMPGQQTYRTWPRCSCGHDVTVHVPRTRGGQWQRTECGSWHRGPCGCTGYVPETRESSE